MRGIASVLVADPHLKSRNDLDDLRMTVNLHRRHSPALGKMTGFSLIELVAALAIIAILAAIAVPSYSSYVTQSRAKGATSDLVAMSLTLENDFQKNLAYPTYTAGTAVPALPASRTGTQVNDFSTWAPAEGNYYTYTVSSSASLGTYTVTATAIGSVNCTLSLSNANVRTASGSSCGFTSW
jgi:type IV pilus assembly protein PilE